LINSAGFFIFSLPIKLTVPAPATAPIVGPMSFFLSAIIPVPDSTIPPITATLAAELQPFY
jgi:hypothetical protein